jgi:hypothetical protein
MPQVGFEHATPMFERAKRVHALDGAATVIGSQVNITGSETRRKTSIMTIRKIAMMKVVLQSTYSMYVRPKLHIENSC